MSLSLSRRQLAAALLEYDNDPDDDLKPRVNALESALFLPFRPPPPPPPSLPLPSGLADSSDHRSESPRQRTLAADEGLTSREPQVDHQGTGAAQMEGSEWSQEGTRQEADVSRWNLPAHLLPAEQSSLPLNDLPSVAPSRSYEPGVSSLRTGSVILLRPEEEISPTAAGRAHSVHLDIVRPDSRLDQGPGATEDIEEIDDVLNRAERVRRLVATNGEVEELAGDNLEDRQRTISGQSAGSHRTVHRRMSNPMMVPLPPSPAIRARPMSSLSQTLSTWDDLDRDDRLNDEEDLPNPFALPAPPPEQASRFDPKTLHAQRQSITSMVDLNGDSRSVSHSRPASAMRTLSRQSLTGTEVLSPAQAPDPHSEPQIDRRRSRIYPELDDPGPGSIPLPEDIRVYDDIPTHAEYGGRPLRASKYGPPAPRDRRKTVRPATLVMPAPLSGVEQSPVLEYVPEGWTLGERPLPPGSRTSILSLGGGRPGLPMSLSSRTFRSSLMVDGMRDSEFIGGAEEDGELGVVNEETIARAERRPGKLFGTSLMDQLEARKAHMRNKQRVFTGDSRPAMMARPASYISAGQSPLHETAAGKSRPTSTTIRDPLLQFDENGQLIPSDPTTAKLDRMTKSKSVFGVDQIWEKEMAKLKVMEEEEAVRRRAMDEEKGRVRKEEEERRRKRKGKGKAKAIEQDTSVSPTAIKPHTAAASSSMPSISAESTLADGPPKLEYSPDDERQTSYSAHPTLSSQAPRTSSRIGLDIWANSSDEDDVPQPHKPKPKAKAKANAKAKLSATPARPASSSDDEENVPLSRLAASKAPFSKAVEDSEEDVPLSKLAKQINPDPVTSPSPTHGSLGGGIPSAKPLESANDDDDDVPLMIRRARAQTIASLEGARPGNADEIEDDLPLGYKHAEAAQRQILQHSQSTAPVPPIGDWWSSRASGYSAFQPPAYSPMGMPMASTPFAMAYPPMMSVYGQVAALPMGIMMPPGQMGLAPPGTHPQEDNINRWRSEVRPSSVATGASGSVPSGGR